MSETLYLLALSCNKFVCFIYGSFDFECLMSVLAEFYVASANRIEQSLTHVNSSVWLCQLSQLVNFGSMMIDVKACFSKNIRSGRLKPFAGLES
ncbi:unnamed protein product [Brassica rapa subsp. trilocularis]